MIGPAQRGKGKAATAKEGAVGGGRKTLRFKSDGNIMVEDEPNVNEQSEIQKVDSLLESFLGVSDIDLATRFWELAKNAKNPADLSSAIDNTEQELRDLVGCSTTFVYDLWGVCSDFKRSQHELKK